MKKIIFSLVVVGMIMTLSSFTNTAQSEYVGTYGVGDSNPNQIELKINDDGTFTYLDLSNTSKPIDVQGNWELKNKKIVLKNFESDFSFHSKWKIVKDGMFAKSRKGICFYTLSKL